MRVDRLTTAGAMKFDVARVLEQANAFAFPRRARTEGELRASDVLARAFERAGWQVEVTEIPPRPPWMDACAAGAIVLAGLAVVFFGMVGTQLKRNALGSTAVAVTVIPVVALAAIYGLKSWRRGRSARWPSRNVVARAETQFTSTPRVVVCTPVAEPGYGWPDNRTGLGLMVELARTLPRTIQQRVELHLAGIGGPDGRGIHALARSIRETLPDKPTMLVVTLCPGHGAETLIEGRGLGLQMALRAAHDLWLPTRSGWSTEWPRPREGDATVALLGDRNARAIEPASVRVVAQLVEELALRWAKNHQGDRSAARSSQNPG